MDIDFNIPTIITKRNTDSSGSPISVKLIEVRQVMDSYNCIVLTQIPDELHRIYIEGFTEVFDIERLDKKNFKVDYNQGIIYFHPFNIGKTISIEYYGTGYELISASRVFTKVDKYGNIIDTLESILERSDLQLKLIESLGGAIKVIEKLDENIKNANNLNTYFDEKIPEATGLKNELDTIVTDAKGWKDQLHNDVQEGKKLQPLLHNDVIQGNQTKAELEQTIANAQDDIAIIEATGNEIKYITANQWVWNSKTEMYEYTLTHTMNSKALTISCFYTDTDEFAFIGGGIVDKNNILLRNEDAVNLTVVLNSKYYKPQITASSEVIEELTEARYGEIDLKTKIGKMVSKDNELREQLKTKSNISNKHLEVTNNVNDNIGTTNIANFAGQTLGENAPIGQIVHHYTDGIAYQIDNVGENNNILILKNASNPIRRPDKGNDFVGSGSFLECLEHASENSASKRIFKIDNKGAFYWFDGNNATVLGNNKTDNGESPFKFDVYNKHGKLLEINNNYTTEFLINHKNIGDVLELIGGISAEGGLHLQCIKGPLQITGGNGKTIINGEVLIYNNDTYQSVQTIRNYTPQTRPTPRTVGEFYFDIELHKPVWCKQISPPIWIDAIGNEV